MLCITNMLLHDVENPSIFHDNSLDKNLLYYTDKDKFDKIINNYQYQRQALNTKINKMLAEIEGKLVK